MNSKLNRFSPKFQFIVLHLTKFINFSQARHSQDPFQTLPQVASVFDVVPLLVVLSVGTLTSTSTLLPMPIVLWVLSRFNNSPVRGRCGRIIWGLRDSNLRITVTYNRENLCEEPR